MASLVKHVMRGDSMDTETRNKSFMKSDSRGTARYVMRGYSLNMKMNKKKVAFKEASVHM